MSDRSISSLKKASSLLYGEDLRDFAESLSDDPRPGVKALRANVSKRYVSFLREQERLGRMKSEEERLRREGHVLIAGVDEAGRGPLCGPVVSATVILPKDSRIEGVNDSKKLSEKKREELYDKIISEAVAYRVGVADSALIDEINILNATKRTVEESLASITPAPDIVLLDALTVKTDIPQLSYVKGDARIYSIAAASIIAKVTRDRMMYEYDSMYPGYGFARNKGYGTAEHIEAIRRLGLTPIHRRSFVENILNNQ